MIYEALHGLNPIPSLTSSPTTLPLLFLHPHHSFMKPRMSILQCLHRVLSLPPGILLNVLPILRTFLATLRLQPLPIPIVAILFPLCFIFSHHSTSYICFTYLTYFFPYQNIGFTRVGSFAFCGVFWSVFFAVESPVCGIYGRHSVTVW